MNISGADKAGAAQARWANVAAQLKQYRDQQRASWGNVDDALVAKYIAGEATDAEKEQVETAIKDNPNIKQAIEVIQEVLKEE